MNSTLLFRPDRDDDLPSALRLLGIDMFVLADVCDPEPIACIVVRDLGDDAYEICAMTQRSDVDDDGVESRLLAGAADWLRARGARRLGEIEL